MTIAAPTKRVTTAVRFPEGLHRQLQEHAEMRDVSVNWLVTRAVQQFLDGLPTREVVEATLRKA
jgi:predicted HicB family RNase H-like nuclease